jgi:acetolactate synthase I/II/III large subunit
VAEGYKIIAEALVAAGVDTIFGVMGEGNMPVIDHWVHDLGKSYIAARHEGGAVSMAEGYARAGNRIGVATVTQGPGLTNTLTALTTAVRQHAPVLLLPGALPLEGSPSAQNIDHKAVVAASGAEYRILTSVHSARKALYAALHRLQTTWHPLVLDLPIDLQEMDWPRTDDQYRPAEALGVRPMPSPEAVERAVDLLTRAERPVVLAGKGATAARDDLVAIAEHLGAPLATSLQGKGLFGGHPLDVGVAGGFAYTHTQTILGNSDCVLAVGASLNTWTLQHGATFPEAEIIHVDVDPQRMGVVTPVAVPIVADAGATATALLTRLRDAAPPATDRCASVEGAVAAGRDDEQAKLEVQGALIAGEHVIGAVEPILPADRTVVLDAGHFMGWPILYLSVPEPSAFLWTCDFGSIGLGAATAVGAALARPDRLTVLVAGDGGLMMSLGELETIARYGLRMVVLVLNDEGYGAEVQILKSQGRRPETALFTNPDLTAVAAALGFDTLRLESTDDLDKLAKSVTELDGPLFVEARIDDRIAPWFQHMLP